MRPPPDDGGGQDLQAKPMDMSQENTGAKNQRISVLIVDSCPVPRRGLVQLIEDSVDLRVCGEVEQAHEIDGRLEADRPDVVVVNVTLVSGNGLDSIKAIKRHDPELRVLVFSHHDEAVMAPRAIRAGAAGYITCNEPPERVLEAIRAVASGEIFLSGPMARRMCSQMVNGRAKEAGSPLDRLTDRELEIYHLIGKCLGTREIAEQLNVSMKTVSAHRTHIMRKMACRSGVELMRSAVQWVQPI